MGEGEETEDGNEEDVGCGGQRNGDDFGDADRVTSVDRDSEINYNDDGEWEDLDDDDKQVAEDEENAELEGAVEPGRHSLSRSSV